MAFKISRYDTLWLLAVSIPGQKYTAASPAALKDAIWQIVSAITQEMLLNAVNGVVTSLTAVLLNDGQHIEHLL
ncbi:hypothetical protein TNCV_4591161 [Trichonephila clavipes]|nr:hypothetical protein TNCV_4591161 [Trichonephila clavipes]